MASPKIPDTTAYHNVNRRSFFHLLKMKYFLFIVFAATISLIAIFKFDKIHFSFSNGKSNAVINGEKITSPNVTNTTHIANGAEIEMPSVKINQTTTGSQSPIVNNSNGSATINYGSK